MDNGNTLLCSLHALFSITFIFLLFILKRKGKQMLGLSILFGLYLSDLGWAICTVLFNTEWTAVALYTIDLGIILLIIALITFVIQVLTK